MSSQLTCGFVSRNRCPFDVRLEPKHRLRFGESQAIAMMRRLHPAAKIGEASSNRMVCWRMLRVFPKDRSNEGWTFSQPQPKMPCSLGVGVLVGESG